MTLGKVLVTGGTGCIGSHAAVQLLNAGYSVVLYDNLSNSSREVVHGITSLTGRSVTFIEGDNRERHALRAALRDPAEYYEAPNLAMALFGREARLDCEKMCADTWRWKKTTPMAISFQD